MERGTTHSVSQWKTEIQFIEDKITAHKNIIAILELGDNLNQIMKQYEIVYSLREQISKIESSRRKIRK